MDVGLLLGLTFYATSAISSEFVLEDLVYKYSDLIELLTKYLRPDGFFLHTTENSNAESGLSALTHNSASSAVS